MEDYIDELLEMSLLSDTEELDEIDSDVSDTENVLDECASL